MEDLYAEKYHQKVMIKKYNKIIKVTDQLYSSSSKDTHFLKERCEM